MKFTILAAAIVIPVFSTAIAQDVQPMDTKQVIEALKMLREQRDAGLKARKQAAHTQVSAAAASGDRAVAFWKEAVKAAQFEGAERQASKLSDWRDAEGELLNSKEAQAAVRLHLNWLALSLQHSLGIENTKLLPAVIDHTRLVRTEALAMERFENTIERAKDRPNRDQKDIREDQGVKRVHDQILRMPVNASPVSAWLQLSDLLIGGQERRRNGRGGEPEPKDAKADANGWNYIAGDVDGIYGSIILPAFRAAKDPRLLEYWDLKLKEEGEKAADKKLDIAMRDWTQKTRPAILWSRAQDLIILGQKNRALGEMFNLIKTHPQHPAASEWMLSLEEILLPPGVQTTEPVPATPGTVAAPVPVPAATTPAAPAPPGFDPFRVTPKR